MCHLRRSFTDFPHSGWGKRRWMWTETSRHADRDILECWYLGVSINGGTPSHHPFEIGIFHDFLYKPSIWGYPHWWKPPFSSWQKTGWRTCWEGFRHVDTVARCCYFGQTHLGLQSNPTPFWKAFKRSAEIICAWIMYRYVDIEIVMHCNSCNTPSIVSYQNTDSAKCVHICIS